MQDTMKNPGGAPASQADTQDGAVELRFGVVLFDGGQPGPGWACEGGRSAVKDTPFRFETPAELGNTTLWLTNADYQGFMASGLTTSGFFRRNEFLKVTIPFALAEWGLGDQDPSHAAAVLAECFGRVMGHCASAFKRALSNATWRRRAGQHGPIPTEDRIRAEAIRQISSPTLVHDLAGLVYQPEDYPADMVFPLENARQLWTRTSFISSKSKTEVVLRRPRLAHAISMLRQSFPVGPWEFVPGDRMQGEGAAAKLAWIDETKRPAIVNIALPSGTEVATLQVFGFGQGAMDAATKKPARRTWAPLPEALELSRIAECEVQGAWIGKGFEKVESVLVPGLVDALDHPALHASWSAGVFAECLWLAACKSIRKGERRGYDKRQQPPGPRDVWLRMIDRIAMYRDAMRLHEMGHTVINYSIGAIKVSASSMEVTSLLKDAFGIGLTPQLTTIFDTSDIEVPSPEDWGGDRRGLQEAWIRSTAAVDRDLARHSLWDIDGLGEMDASMAARRVAEIGEAVVERVYGPADDASSEDGEGGRPETGGDAEAGDADLAEPPASYMGGMPAIDFSVLGAGPGDEIAVTRRIPGPDGKMIVAERTRVAA